MDPVNKAVFCDRDGVVIRDCGYLDDPQQIEILRLVPAAIRRLNQSGYLVVIVTNQSGVARGLFPEERVHSVHAAIERSLAAEGARVDAFYYCPHHPAGVITAYRQDCYCRKPRPGMILKAAQDLNIDVRKSFMVGDKQSDIEAGCAAGLKSFLIVPNRDEEPGQVTANLNSQVSNVAADDLFEAVELILG